MMLLRAESLLRREARAPALNLGLFAGLLLAWLALGPLAIAPAAAQTAAQTAVDLELVIAVDVSLSMDLDEQRLQRDGYIGAFRDDEVHKAITSGAHGRIAIVYMEWAGPTARQVVVPWMVIDSADASRAFAAQLEATPISRARMTSISAALEFSGQLFAGSGVRGVRRVVDVSGDGPNNAGDPVAVVRDELVGRGIVINGLPIMLKMPSGAFDLPDLDRYYTGCVIGGAGSFMIPIRQLGEFKSATRRKLLLEIAALEPPPRLIRVQGGPAQDPPDCMVGEKQWRRYLDRGFPN